MIATSGSCEIRGLFFLPSLYLGWYFCNVLSSYLNRSGFCLNSFCFVWSVNVSTVLLIMDLFVLWVDGVLHQFVFYFITHTEYIGVFF